MTEAIARGASVPDEATDEHLMTLIAEGHQGALAQLYDRHSSAAYGLAVRITGDVTLAQDVVQEAFLGAWRNAGRYLSARASARTWLLSITHHRAIDAIRRRRPTVELPGPEMPPPAQMVEPDVWGEVAGRLDREAVLRAIGVLSRPQREAIELAYFGGLTQQEIAARTNTPLGTVKSRVRLALLALREALEAETRAHPTPGRGEPTRDRASGATG